MTASPGRCPGSGPRPTPTARRRRGGSPSPPTERYLFAVTAGSDDISRDAIAQDGTLTLLGTTTVSGNNPGPFDAEVSPDGRTLYVNESAAHAVGVFAVQGGDLTELQSSTVALPAGATAAGVSVVASRGWR
jgi:hypothetical protein